MAENILVDAKGQECPIPVIKTLQALRDAAGGTVVVTEVDNEAAVENLRRLAGEKGCTSETANIDGGFAVSIVVPEGGIASGDDSELVASCTPARKNVVIQVASDTMGIGSDELGSQLLKGFIYALTQLEEVPATILFYNDGARVSCEGSPSVEDLRALEERGVEILTCGTCLNHLGLTDKLAVGGVTNMYVIAEKLTGASCVVRP